ncbi:MAG: hypothetical protein LBT40_04730 [Deltaproteobacteria bacterium]|jgi:hypothetical protein|nr:hypothetical protein [Deltaproteobacteria bacterium]
MMSSLSTILGLTFFSTVLMAAGDLLAAAKKPGRRAGRRRGRPGAGKGAPRRPPAAPSAAPTEGMPATPAPTDGGPVDGGGDAALGRGDSRSVGTDVGAAVGTDVGVGVGTDVGTEVGGADGRGAGTASGDCGRTGRSCEGDVNDGPAGGAADVPPEFPEAPAWSFPPDGKLLGQFRSVAESMGLSGDVDPSGAAAGWEILRGLYRASRGPDDPRLGACMSRAALAISRRPDCLEDAAALAAGACEALCREPEAEAGGGEGDADVGPAPGCGSLADGDGDAAGDDAGRALLREKEFALKVLAASRGALARQPGRNPDIPFPAPVRQLRRVRDRGVVPQPATGPGPDELRSDLAAAERDGAGSRETLVIRSRLGEALADAEARARASVTTLIGGNFLQSVDSGGSGRSAASGDSGGSGNLRDSGAAPRACPPGAAGKEPAEALLRSASVGLDSLLGRAHPDSMDARERLARCLSGGSGPGLPPSLWRASTRRLPA